MMKADDARARLLARREREGVSDDDDTYTVINISAKSSGGSGETIYVGARRVTKVSECEIGLAITHRVIQPGQGTEFDRYIERRRATLDTITTDELAQRLEARKRAFLAKEQKP